MIRPHWTPLSRVSAISSGSSSTGRSAGTGRSSGPCAATGRRASRGGRASTASDPNPGSSWRDPQAVADLRQAASQALSLSLGAPGAHLEVVALRPDLLDAGAQLLHVTALRLLAHEARHR